jgi:hypothetical protein|tara:strand:+ start:172 stop:282 length:111 start_codon:yes stop_codon:yes gene_type:complete
MILLGIGVVFVVWLVYTSFTLEDPALDNTIEDDYYE